MSCWSIDIDAIQTTWLDRNKNLQNGYFKLFPMNTSGNALSVDPGVFMQIATGKQSEINIDDPTDEQEVMKALYNMLEDPGEDKELVKTILLDIAKSVTDNTRSDLRISLRTKGNTELGKVAGFLASLAGGDDELTALIENALEEIEGQAHIVERMVYDLFPLEEVGGQSPLYYVVPSNLSGLFKKDLRLVLSEPKLRANYFLPLLEFYCCMGILQTCTMLKSLARNQYPTPEPIYFALDFESTTHRRACYTKGYRAIEPALREAFVHAVTLEALNTNKLEDKYDYVGLRLIAEKGDDENRRMARIVRELSDRYRAHFQSETVEVDPIGSEPRSAIDEIEYLYSNIHAVLHTGNRDGVRKKYMESFVRFCQGKRSFIKVRGNSGRMFNITEEVLLLLTIISIGGDQDKVSRTDLFRSFEQRGVYLDEPSKDAAISFFEARNMIEKKSDSGEAQYVRRIL